MTSRLAAHQLLQRSAHVRRHLPFALHAKSTLAHNHDQLEELKNGSSGAVPFSQLHSVKSLDPSWDLHVHVTSSDSSTSLLEDHQYLTDCMKEICNTHYTAASQPIKHPLTELDKVLNVTEESPSQLDASGVVVSILKQDNEPCAFLCSPIFDSPYLRYPIVHTGLGVRAAGLPVYPRAITWLALGWVMQFNKLGSLKLT